MSESDEAADIRRVLERLRVALIEANVMLRLLAGLPVRVEVVEREGFVEIVVGWLYDDSSREVDPDASAAQGGGPGAGGPP